MRRAVLAFVLVTTMGCATATPVTPAPVDASDAPKLEAALIGSCEVTATQSVDGEPKAAKGIHFTFGRDGSLHYHIETPIATVDKNYTYRLEGRNILSTGTYKAMRVDDWSQGKLKLFLYDTTEFFHCTKE